MTTILRWSYILRLGYLGILFNAHFRITGLLAKINKKKLKSYKNAIFKEKATNFRLFEVLFFKIFLSEKNFFNFF